MLFRLFFYGWFILFSSACWSQAWIAPNSLPLKSQITYLQQQGVIHAPITTWPIAWQSIATDLENCIQQPPSIAIGNLCQALLKTHHHTQSLHINAGAYVANDQPLLNSFNRPYRGKSGTQLNVSTDNKHWSGQLSLNQIDASIDQRSFQLDGSYLSTHSDNWALGVGAVDRWWGPGWDSSLIWSTNPRPIPGVFLSRTTNKPFESTLLNWIGPWQLTTFLGQLETHRDIPNALFLGLRFNFQPWTPLEIGLSRTALWGGEGRSESLNTLGNLLIGYDNTSGPSEPGNQLAGLDATLSFPINTYTSAIYFQYIGEDEAGGLPAKSLGLAGLSLSKANMNSQWTFFLEASDTAVNVLSKAEFNVAYEHHLYTDGYRYYGRAIGSTYDNDTRTFILGLTGSVNRTHQLSITAGSIDFNRDGTGDHGLIHGAQRSRHYTLSYTHTHTAVDFGFTLSKLSSVPDNTQLADKTDNLTLFVSKDFK